jgi:hypothetical protein
MTAAANRERLLGLPHHCCVNASNEFVLDSVVAFAARCGDVPWVHRRCGVTAREDAVRRVAIGAHCRHREPALHEPFAVNAFGVPLDDLVLSSRIANGRFLTFAMTPCAQIRNIGGKGWRLRIALSQNTVRPVTLFARRSVRIFLRNEPAVNTLLILKTDFGMTRRAIYLFLDGLARPDPGGINVRMTLTTRDLAVT